ncbi:MAG: TonB-dependent receptor [Clostridiales bacterium]|nr:TonB-dependent receptor [Clostridiales bacterium]
MPVKKSHIILPATLLAASFASQARNLNIHVVDGQSGIPLEMAALSFSRDGKQSASAYTGSDGTAMQDLKNGEWTINVWSVGYKPTHINISITDTSQSSYTLRMLPLDPIDEVVVTAREGRHATSSSIIDSTAMQHLQPSSFTDLLELIPGNISKDPSMGSPNVINLRTATNISGTDNDYMTSAIGTSFVVDGVPINNNAVMQTTTDSNHSVRATVGKGVDMRTIATDDIEKVEIVRGIASVEYGELTSGLVNIKRKSGVTRLEARFKADSKSQLFYVGKGIKMPGNDWIINAGIGYLDAKIDQRNPRENYNRVNGSIRSNKRFSNTVLLISWNSSLNYTGSFESDNNDPDLTINNTIDRFNTKNHTVSWNNVLTVKPVENKIFRDASLTTGLSYSRERLHQTRHVAASRIMPMTVSLVPGPNYAGYLPMLYLATLDVEGDPFTAYIKAATTLGYTSGTVTYALKGGIEWNMSKNYGRGNIYDLERPITAESGTRPRAFNDIPAMHQLSIYAESRNTLRLGRHTVEASIGLRETMLLHLDSKYKLAGKPYLDPRFTMSWTMPAIYIAGNPLIPELNGGLGWQTKMPVASFLYPAPRYTDIEQLNYYHNVPEYRVMNVMTFIDDVTNYNLLAARNFKWEVRADFSYHDNRLSVTYFREKMHNGFRHTGDVLRYNYHRYDASGFDPYAAGRGPMIEELPYTEASYQAIRPTVVNGSSTMKEGVEYTFQTRRFPVIHTRMTLSGAWLRTTNGSSTPLWYNPGVTMNGQQLQYFGLYDDVDGSTYESLNTNIMLDTDLPKLGLRFSIAIQNMWFTSRRTLFRDGTPTHYMDPEGNVYPFTEESLNNPYTRQLVRQFAATAFDRHSVPSETAINLKATKTFWNNRVNIALYVNRLFTIMPDYKSYGMTIRRYSNPYFGMELNLKI